MYRRKSGGVTYFLHRRKYRLMKDGDRAARTEAQLQPSVFQPQGIAAEFHLSRFPVGAVDRQSGAVRRTGRVRRKSEYLLVVFVFRQPAVQQKPQ